MIQEFFLNSYQINDLNSYRRFHQHFHISITFISGSLFNEMWYVVYGPKLSTIMDRKLNNFIFSYKYK